jgi:hypothetical protein
MTEGLGASAALSSAIADMILKKGLSYTLSEDPLMARVLKYAKAAPASYKPPTRQDVGGRYLDTFYIRHEKKNDELIVEVSKKFGWSMMSDGATVLHIPLVNVLAGLPNVLPVMLEIADCTGHMQGGGKKNGMFIATLMQKIRRSSLRSSRRCRCTVCLHARRRNSIWASTSMASSWTWARTTRSCSSAPRRTGRGGEDQQEGD